ncbi:MAG: sulfotransferase domain-containing protein, partial [Gemmatimonadota bacterium]
TTLYAVSPWLEADKSVPVGDAPLLGRERPSRIIKTHLPVSHCPYGAGARYVYVARHPVSCFASCVDFIATNVGAMAPDLNAIEAWFTSERMWWGPWPAHVAGWWERARREENVLFVRFEDMKEDLPTVARGVTAFLGLAPLAREELEGVLHKCGFDYMRGHSAAFEMHPPHILATDAELFVRGTADRLRDVPGAVRDRIARWCTAELEARGVRPEELYPDLAADPRPSAAG